MEKYLTCDNNNLSLEDLIKSLILSDNGGEPVLYTTLGDASIVSITPVISTGIYSANDNIGGLQTLTDAMRSDTGSGYLMSVEILDKDNEKAAMEIYIFESNPTAGTYTDNVAMVIGTDLSKVLAKATVSSGDYTTVGSVAIAVVSVKELVKSTSGKNLYAAARVTGTPTYTAVNDLTFRYKFDRY